MDLPLIHTDQFAQLSLGEAAHGPALTDAHTDKPVGGGGGG
jgi:hypothetical protein